MTDETIVQSDEGGESLPEVKSVPKSDAEAAEQEAAATPEVQASEKPKPDPAAQDKEERQRNRTTQYIEHLKQKAAAAEAKVAELAAKVTPAPAKAPSPDEPTLDKFDYDIAAFTRAHADWAVKEALSARDQEQQTRAKESERQEALSRYEEQVQAALDEYPDFYEVVGTINPQFITPELEAAIIKHPNGARLAYHIGTNDDDAFLLASTRPELVSAAVDRLAKRLNAPAAAPIAAPTPKPITQAPAPPPSLSGKSAVSVPAEKLTDEQWLAREKERARRR